MVASRRANRHQRTKLFLALATEQLRRMLEIKAKERARKEAETVVSKRPQTATEATVVRSLSTPVLLLDQYLRTRLNRKPLRDRCTPTYRRPAQLWMLPLKLPIKSTTISAVETLSPVYKR